MRKALILIVVSVFFSGCATTPPKDMPVISEKIALALSTNDETNVFSLTPERRTVIVVATDPVTAKELGEKIPPIRFCAEPPPDVAEGIASSFKILAEVAAEAPVSENSIKAATDISKSFSTSIDKLFSRTQGVQFFRDGLFSLCQAHLNGLIDKAEYSKSFGEIIDKSYKLAEKEIELKYKK